jgi:sulfotransferase family protein
MNKIYWLASYPKSGNTWMRIFLTNYLEDADQPADINKLKGGPIASDRDLFDRWAGVEASDLPAEEIADLRPYVYRQMALHIGHPLYLKVHDACTRNSEGEPLFPQDVTAGVLYMIRNPLDVCVSYAHHGGRPVEQVAENLCRADADVPENLERIAPQLLQRLLSWSDHVRSWVDDSGMPATVIRYEDLLTRPEAEFERALRSLQLDLDPARLRKAIAFSSFDATQEQEKRVGFKEKAMRADALFFREGRAGTWRAELGAAVVDKIVSAHRDVMRRFGYLDASDAPLF